MDETFPEYEIGEPILPDRATIDDLIVGGAMAAVGAVGRDATGEGYDPFAEPF